MRLGSRRVRRGGMGCSGHKKKTRRPRRRSGHRSRSGRAGGGACPCSPRRRRRSRASRRKPRRSRSRKGGMCPHCTGGS